MNTLLEKGKFQEMMYKKSNVTTWIYGHTHFNSDFQLNENIRIISNQFGTVLEREHFRKDFVFEHIKKDGDYVKEIHRVLKKGGKFIVTTPNKKMSLTRNPWHIREYTVDELTTLLKSSFSSVEANGVFGNDVVMEYYNINKKSVQKIMRFDILNLQYNLPRQILQVPYDIMNRRNRNKLSDSGSHIKMEDYFVAEAKDDCIDLFYIAEK